MMSWLAPVRLMDCGALEVDSWLVRDEIPGVQTSMISSSFTFKALSTRLTYSSVIF